MVKEYLLKICCTALLLAGIRSFPIANSAVKNTIKLISGISMVLVLFSPIINLKISDRIPLDDFLSPDGLEAVYAGTDLAVMEEKRIITEQVQTYIINKARSLEASISVKIELSDERPFVPVSAMINGNASPYVRTALTAFMQNELGIEKEDLIWTPE